MKTLLFIVALAGCIPSSSQSVEPILPTELELKEAAVASSRQGWKSSDRGIEGELFREPLDKFLAHNEKAASARRSYDGNRLALSEASVKDARKQVADLEKVLETHGGPEAEEMERSLDRRLDQLTNREMALRRGIGEKEPGVSADRQVLLDELKRQEIDQIASIRQSIFDQKQILRRVATTKTALATSAGELLVHARKVVRSLESDKDRIQEEADLWQQYYRGLRTLATEQDERKRRGVSRP